MIDFCNVTQLAAGRAGTRTQINASLPNKIYTSSVLLVYLEGQLLSLRNEYGDVAVTQQDWGGPSICLQIPSTPTSAKVLLHLLSPSLSVPAA